LLTLPKARHSPGLLFLGVMPAVNAKEVCPMVEKLP